MLHSTHVNYLDRPELEHELRVRGLTDLESRRMEDMRSDLRKFLNKERAGISESSLLEGDFDDARICHLKLREIERLLGLLALPSPTTDVKKLQKKLEASLTHTKLRVGRLSKDCEAEKLEMTGKVEHMVAQFEKLLRQSLHTGVHSSSNDDEKLSYAGGGNKNGESLKKIKDNVLTSKNDLESSDSNCLSEEDKGKYVKKKSRNKKKRKSHHRRKGRRHRSSSSSTESTSSTSEYSDNQRSHRIFSKSKITPVRHWNLKFSGDDNTSVGSFLADVEDRRVANNMSFREIFLAAGDLFSGSALVVYRSCRGRISNWQELEVKLRNAFQDPDYDRRLVREIESRKQGSEETVTVYIAKMRSLFSRLTKPKHEEDMLEIIEENILPEYQSVLSLQTYRNVDELENILLRLEKGRLRALRFDTKPSRNLLEPDLAYKPKTRRDNVKVSALESRPDEFKRNNPKRSSSSVICWNCKIKGHVFSDCRKPRSIFCFGCGKENIVKSKCTKCNPRIEKETENSLAERRQSGPRSAETPSTK